MNIQSFIQSGLLEAYVLGQCSVEEQAEVERMAARHKEVRAELNAIEISLEGLAKANAVQPPDWMKTNILEQIEREKASASPTDFARKGTSKFWLRALMFLAFALLAAIAALFLKQQNLGRENQDLRFQADSLKQQLIACNQDLQKPDPIAELLCDPSTQRILVSDGNGLNTIVYYNPILKKMAYDPYNLPTPKEGKFFQFWAIVDGNPVSMGMKSESICASLRSVENAIAFAISEEGNSDGNIAPTKVLAIGNAG